MRLRALGPMQPSRGIWLASLLRANIPTNHRQAIRSPRHRFPGSVSTYSAGRILHAIRASAPSRRTCRQYANEDARTHCAYNDTGNLKTFPGCYQTRPQSQTPPGHSTPRRSRRMLILYKPKCERRIALEPYGVQLHAAPGGLALPGAPCAAAAACCAYDWYHRAT
jgi:hypothetical protein